MTVRGGLHFDTIQPCFSISSNFATDECGCLYKKFWLVGLDMVNPFTNQELSKGIKFKKDITNAIRISVEINMHFRKKRKPKVVSDIVSLVLRKICRLMKMQSFPFIA